MLGNMRVMLPQERPHRTGMNIVNNWISADASEGRVLLDRGESLDRMRHGAGQVAGVKVNSLTIRMDQVVLSL